jgi:hypothetical protein
VKRTRISAAQRLGLRFTVALAHSNFAVARLGQGARADARAHALAALDEIQRMRTPRMEALASCAVAAVDLADGDFAEAERRARAVVECEQRGPFRAYAEARLAEVLVAAGRHPEALEVTRAAFAGLAPGTELEDNMTSVLQLAHIEALWSVGERDEARARLSEARARLVAHAASIDRPAWRDTFLRAVPTHARILARAEAWLGAER